MRHVLGLHILALLAAPPLVAQEPVEELPPPRSETSVLVQPPGAVQDRRPASWRLVGPGGQHYFVGSSVLADYLRGDQRHIVALEREDPNSHASPDPNFLYFREPDGRRWAFSVQPSADGRFRIYSQDAGSSSVWSLFQRASRDWDGQSEPGCGH